MTVKCATVIQQIEQLAPKSLAEEWDNVGLLLGDPSAQINGVLLTLDIDREVFAEAVRLNANLIISHHPLIFKPMKNISTNIPQGALLSELLRQEINVYCAHTNLDIAPGGVNDVLAGLLQLQGLRNLSNNCSESLYKIVVYVPQGCEDAVREALAAAGAGHIGNYSHCAFQAPGTGTFLPLAGTDPFIGKRGKLEKVEEYRLETIVPEKLLSGAVNAMLKAHPYEEVAYDIYALANEGRQFGLGRVGELSCQMQLGEFAEKVKKALGINSLKIAGNQDVKVSRVAVCGGSGGKLIDQALFAGAQVLVTGDVDYHQAQYALSCGLAVIDAGHGATERPVVNALAAYLEENLSGRKQFIPIYVSKINTDPWL